MTDILNTFTNLKSLIRLSPVFIIRLFKGHIAESREAIYGNNKIDNINALFDGPHEIIDNIYVGSGYHASNWELLEKLEITHIINVAVEIPNYFENDIDYLKIDKIKDDGEEIYNKNELDILLENIHKILKNKKNKLFIHCLVGRSRSVTILIAYLIKYHKINLDESLKLIKSKREYINPSLKLIDFLKKNYNN
jgi:atypical dual specificity phosphatase